MKCASNGHATHLFLQAAEVPTRQVPRLRRDGASGVAVLLLGIRLVAGFGDEIAQRGLDCLVHQLRVHA